MSDSETITITCNEVNREPELTVPLEPQIVAAGSTLVFAVSVTDLDIPQNFVSIQASGLPPTAVIIIGTDPHGIAISYTHDESEVGMTFTVIFTATDNGVPQLSDSETVIIKVTGTISVSVDIKPGSDPNSVNVKLNGLIPVAVLTTSVFDASSVDPLSVRFGRTGTEAMPVRSGLEDIDRDGDLDLILHFKVEDTGIQAGDTEARLTSRTFDGSMITGSDMVHAFFPGDVNGDFVVDILDLALLGAAFGSTSWNPYADFDENRVINVLDLVIVGRYFGRHA